MKSASILLLCLILTSLLLPAPATAGQKIIACKHAIYTMPEHHKFTLYIKSNVPVTAKVEIKPIDSGQNQWWNRYGYKNTGWGTNLIINTSTPPNRAGWHVMVTIVYDASRYNRPQLTLTKVDR